MSTHKHIDKICALAAVAALLLAILFMFAPSLGVTASEWMPCPGEILLPPHSVNIIELR